MIRSPCPSWQRPEAISVKEPTRLLFWFAIFFLAALAVRPWLDDILIAYRAEPRAITARGDLAADEQTTIAIFEAATPSVVYISG